MPRLRKPARRFGVGLIPSVSRSRVPTPDSRVAGDGVIRRGAGGSTAAVEVEVGMQHPLMSLVRGDGDQQAVGRGRRRAAEALVAGYEAAVIALDPSDADELAWYRERLRDARLGAEHACAEHPLRAFS